MENKIPTAEEVALAYRFINGFSVHSNTAKITESFYGCMIEFARIHVEAALKAATEIDRPLKQASLNSNWVNEIATYSNDFCLVHLNKDPILNAYPLENIK